MPVDPSIALQTQTLNPTNLISGFLDLGLKKTALERQRATLPADIERAKAESSSAQSAATVNAANVNPLIQQQAAQTAGAQTQLNSQQLENARAHAANIAQQLETLRQKPDLSRADIIHSAVDSALNANAPNAALVQMLQGIPEQGSSEDYRKFVMQTLVKTQALSQHLATIAPSPAFINTGQQAVPVASGNPSVTGVPAGTPQGVATQMQLPPTATTMQGNQPAYVGPQSGGTGPVPSGPAIGQVEGTTGPIQVANQHFQQVQASAQAAPTRIAALQTIMQEAPEAMKGGGDYRRTFLQQLSGLFGGNAEWAVNKQTANDVMAKNLSLIAGAAGNTDAARALSEMATPNYKMTGPAIQQTGQQLLGIERKNQVAGQFFSGIPTNDPSYTVKMTQWNKVADPRLFEYAALPDDQKAAWRNKLSPGVKAELAMKAKALHDMGVTP